MLQGKSKGIYVGTKKSLRAIYVVYVVQRSEKNQIYYTRGGHRSEELVKWWSATVCQSVSTAS